MPETIRRPTKRWCPKCGEYVFAHREPDAWRCVACGTPTEYRSPEDEAAAVEEWKQSVGYKPSPTAALDLWPPEQVESRL